MINEIKLFFKVSCVIMRMILVFSWELESYIYLVGIRIGCNEYIWFDLSWLDLVR